MPAAPRSPRRTGRRVLAGLTVAAAVLAAIVFGRSVGGGWARHIATRHMEQWAISDALRWLHWAERIEPRTGTTPLLQARCFGRLGENRLRQEALQRAERYGATPEDVERERTLGLLQLGQAPEETESRLQEFSEAGFSPQDIATSFIGGSMARQNMPRAEELLRAWLADFPDDAHSHYLHGVFLAGNNDLVGAREQLEQALAIQPRHELAQLALAKIHEQRNELDEALQRYVALANRLPDTGPVLVGLSRVLRKTGRAEQARDLLAPLASNPAIPNELVLELALVALELGDYEQSTSWFDRLPEQEFANHDTLSAAGVLLGLQNDTAAAERAFDRIAREMDAVTHMHDLQERLAGDAQDQHSEAELQALIRRIGTFQANFHPLATTSPWDSQAPPPSPELQLYATHCAACHGVDGEGDGRAARHVFPRPRDLRAESMRLVSTVNGVPTLDDIRHIIRDGIPGTSMAPMEYLTDEQVNQLAQVVQRMRREGIRRQYLAMLRADMPHLDPEDEQEAEEVAILRTRPGDVAVIPPIGTPHETSVARGRELYVQQACHTCHGMTGEGDENMPLFDDAGRPAFPRDLVHDRFKGGNDGPAIYRRILLGMPGTPHPANVSLSSQEMIDLVQFCLSLGQEPKRDLTNHQRARQAASRPAVSWP